MKFSLLAFIAILSICQSIYGQSFRPIAAPLIEASCIHCHDGDSDNELNLLDLDGDLSDSHTFKQWEKIYNRAKSGEMPPASEPPADLNSLKAALTAIEKDLFRANLLTQQEHGRVRSRRLTKRELGYTLQDLLSISHVDHSSIPEEADTGNFDTVGSNQRISSLHMEGYLQAAENALEQAIQLEKNPYISRESDFAFIKSFHDMPLNQGGNISRDLEDGTGVVLFHDVDYLTPFTYEIRHTGIYRLSAEVAAYQTTQPLTAKIIAKSPSSGEVRIAAAVDVTPNNPQTISVDTLLKPGDLPYLTFDREGNHSFPLGGSKNYKGRGLAIYSQKIEGPLSKSWPPQSTQKLLLGVNFKSQTDNNLGPFEIESGQSDENFTTTVINNIAPRVFRREVAEQEILPFHEIAKAELASGQPSTAAMKVALRSMLSSPQFLIFQETQGQLDDFALANRLSYFFWKSLPDAELFELAKKQKLSQSGVLSQQVERLLNDEKSSRFVNDFVGQWLRVYKLNATTPDDQLYPEFDELLSDSIPKETQLFFRELIDENLGTDQLIDSEFTFLNRRLAKHYRIDGVEGQQFQRVMLPPESPRGGILTQAAILKTTANGTTTSPVMRGNFVLTNFLGTPPSPPPPGIGSIEPDTRGKTTIREILTAHRDLESCNQCHQKIDPPGFALESFDPIGRYRTHYRIAGGKQNFFGFENKLPPKKGLPVDSSGVSAHGKQFEDITEFKKILLENREQVARNFIGQLVVYATGAEIEFADRQVIDSIEQQTREKGYPIRDIIHAVIESRLFQHK